MSSFCEALRKNLTTGFPTLPWIQGYQRYRYTKFSTYICIYILTPLFTRNHDSKSVEFYQNRDIFYFLGPYLFIFQGPYFQWFGSVHANNVYSVGMHKTMSKLDPSVLSNILHYYCIVLLYCIICRYWFFV